jgi:hypothetical protein
MNGGLVGKSGGQSILRPPPLLISRTFCSFNLMIYIFEGHPYDDGRIRAQMRLKNHMLFVGQLE